MSVEVVWRGEVEELKHRGGQDLRTKAKATPTQPEEGIVSTDKVATSFPPRGEVLTRKTWPVRNVPSAR